jgi:hypothetical protein
MEDSNRYKKFFVILKKENIANSAGNNRRMYSQEVLL